MNVLSVASEAFPLIKTGGLADVAGALPIALEEHDITMRTLIPGYPAVMGKLPDAAEVAGFPGLVLGKEVRLLAAEHAGASWLVLDSPSLFDRPGGPYAGPDGRDFPDNWLRFAVFAKTAALIAEGLADGWKPEVVHAHDWQAGLVPVYLGAGNAAGTPSVLTVHNIAFQGQFGADIFAALELPWSDFTVDGVEYYGDVSFLKGGLQRASAITTVSPTYAREITTPDFGMGLDGLINARADRLFGFVNGIDTSVWNPQTDPDIASPFYARTMHKRPANRKAVRERFGLDEGDAPIIAVISRLTWQKGMDVLAEAAEGIAAMGAQLAILGSGDASLEYALSSAAERNPGMIGMVRGFDEPLSHLIQAGADAILIPSRFEPCGLTQLYGLRYGTVPIVARTGGLADTIIDANEAALSAGVATGFQFSSVTVDGLHDVIRRVMRVWQDEAVWGRMQRQAMKADVSWTRPSMQYASLYRMLVNEKQ